MTLLFLLWLLWFFSLSIQGHDQEDTKGQQKYDSNSKNWYERNFFDIHFISLGTVGSLHNLKLEQVGLCKVSSSKLFLLDCAADCLVVVTDLRLVSCNRTAGETMTGVAGNWIILKSFIKFRFESRLGQKPQIFASLLRGLIWLEPSRGMKEQGSLHIHSRVYQPGLPQSPWEHHQCWSLFLH